MTEKKFPILNQPYQRERALTEIPWAVAERAYVVYARQYGSSQTLERLAERGGFAESELDNLLPCWRLMSENESEAVWTYKLELMNDRDTLQKENERLTEKVKLLAMDVSFLMSVARSGERLTEEDVKNLREHMAQ